MQGPCAALLLSAGELVVAHQGAAAWYCQEGGSTSSPAPWPWACHSEFPPADPLPWPGPASACPEGVRAGGKRGARSLASARRLGHAFESQAQGTHTQSTEDLCPLGSLHTRAPDYGQSPDGEACCPSIVAGGGCKNKKTWVGGNKRSGECGLRMKSGERSVVIGGQERLQAEPPASPIPTLHLSAGSLVLWRGFSKPSHHMGRLRNARIHVERAVKVGGGWGVS